MPETTRLSRTWLRAAWGVGFGVCGLGCRVAHADFSDMATQQCALARWRRAWTAAIWGQLLSVEGLVYRGALFFSDLRPSP